MLRIKQKKIIRNKLIEVAKNNDVQILFAIESGSRAWGFPSTNSDYDVRFVYAHS
jgi:predicted nucleotidyltransferase